MPSPPGAGGPAHDARRGWQWAAPTCLRARWLRGVPGLKTSTAIPRRRRDVPLRPGSGYVDALPGARPAAPALAVSPTASYHVVIGGDPAGWRLIRGASRLATSGVRGDASEESAAPESAVFRGLSGPAIADRIPEGALAAGRRRRAPSTRRRWRHAHPRGAAIRLAVWCCLRGASRSATSHARIGAWCGPSCGAARGARLRGGGSAAISACRTVRRCTRWWCTNSRIDRPLSRMSLRICSNSSTFDDSSPFTAGKSDSTERRHSIGRRWGHFDRQLGPTWGRFRVPYPGSRLRLGGGFVDAFQQVSLGYWTAPPIWPFRTVHRNSRNIGKYCSPQPSGT